MRLTMGEKIITSANSLIKFTHPVLVEDKATYFGSATKSAKKLYEEKKAVTIQEILNCVVKPRVYKQDNRLWKQEVSAEPATRTDVERLSENLDARLISRQARESGLCPVRNQLYQEAFSYRFWLK